LEPNCPADGLRMGSVAGLGACVEFAEELLPEAELPELVPEPAPLPELEPGLEEAPDPDAPEEVGGLVEVGAAFGGKDAVTLRLRVTS
jgi:hypothetical protein